MKRFLLILSLFACLWAGAQDLNWVETVGGPGRDLGMMTAVDSGGSVVMLGMFYDSVVFERGPGLMLHSAGSRDLLLARYTKQGALQWAVRIGGPGDEICRKVATDQDGNIYLAGSYYDHAQFSQASGDPVEADTIRGAGIFMARYTPDGTLSWVRSVHSPGSPIDLPESSGMAVRFGSIFLAGNMQGTLDFDPGPGEELLTAYGVSKNIFLARYTLDGELVWARVIQAGGNQIASDVCAGADTSLYFCGRMTGVVDFDAGDSSHYVISDGTWYQGFVAKYDGAGEYVFAQAVTSGSYDGYATSLDVSGEDVLVAGFFKGLADFDPSQGQVVLEGNGDKDIFFGKYSTQGVFKWVKQIGSVGEDYPNDVLAGPRGDIILAGSFVEVADFDPSVGTLVLRSQGGRDGFIARYSSFGNLKKVYRFGDTGDFYIIGLSVDGDTYYPACAYSGWAGLSPFASGQVVRESYGNTDMALVSFSDPEQPVTIQDTSDKELRIFPNPGPGDFLIEWNTPPGRMIRLTVYNLTGVFLLGEIIVTSNAVFQVSLGMLPEGMYLISLDDGISRQHCKAVIRK